jgi:hypothetical protein
VAPIFYKNCVSCHSDGGIAPFQLTDYTQAKAMATAAANAMRKRTMPPWPMTGDGSCGEYLDSRWMSEADIKTVEDWVAAGAPEGVVRDDLKPEKKAALIGGTVFNTPLFEPVAQGGALAQHDEYRCFILPTQLTQDQFLTGYEVIPGNKAMVHHVLVYSVDPNAPSNVGVSNGEQIEILDAQSPNRDGWSCFGTAGAGIESKGIPISWAPGQGATYFPKDTGYRIKSTDRLVVQVHYNLADSRLEGQTDQTQVSLALNNSVAREGFFILHDPLLNSLSTNNPITLAPGKKAVDYTWTLPMAEFTAASAVKKLDFYGSLPHMHERGSKFKAQVVRSTGGSECTAEINQWDIHWQHYYFYSKPFTINATDVIKTTCTYDTSADTAAVLPGWGTQNEMCLYGMFFVPQ